MHHAFMIHKADGTWHYYFIFGIWGLCWELWNWINFKECVHCQSFSIFLFLLSFSACIFCFFLTAHTLFQNPQCDLQAQDRCHRIGQVRPVMVYRLVTANTVDQKIVERATAKRKLEKLIMHRGDLWKLVPTDVNIGIVSTYVHFEDEICKVLIDLVT